MRKPRQLAWRSDKSVLTLEEPGYLEARVGRGYVLKDGEVLEIDIFCEDPLVQNPNRGFRTSHLVFSTFFADAVTELII